MRLIAVVLLLSMLAPPSAQAHAPSGSSAVSVSAAASSPGDRAAVGDALVVLHRWDRARAQAWRRVDERELRSLYVAGSGAGRSDVRMLRAWTSRGLVVRRLRVQVFGVRMLRHSSGRLSLRVLDRVAGGVVEGEAGRWALPSTSPALRRIDFVLTAGKWRVASVGQ